ncbi:hypothetical protein, variant 1 [Aphanomyces invadans]|uniref:Uncharacterized protein n=1 Tax=Aphanomyces invadans TaxID=157072 RepID=A0A024TS38_9STRA|nr:hypothetical protein, variant 1 [Aphanomyces invadans]ETV96177.1 hypothetical protein, variant 1 [Aphanomyces invadans]|eukprot:XP_008874969.1 hypothetical protein, variant 1 [Aphanomyces invadans]
MAKVWLSEDGTKECDGPKAPSRPSRHQIYRVLVKARCDKLKKVKAELEDAIQRLEKEQRRARQPASLSWENIALALKDSSEESRRQNRDLRDKIQAFHQLVNDLAPWAALTRELDPTSTTWRDTSLPIHPESRRMAKTWITQRMIHNTDAMFQQHGFVSRDDQCVDVWCDVDVTVSDTGTLCKIRRNFISPQTLEQSVAFVRENWLEAILIEAPQDSVIHECDGNTKLGTVITSVGEYIHLLWAEFHQGPDRCTFVLRHIVDDDAQSPSAHLHQRSRNIWSTLVKVSGMWT